jgi:hypothetical protein
VTNCVSEFGRNNARNIRSSEAIVDAILIPSSHRHTATVCGASTPTDNNNFPLVEKPNEQTPRLCFPDNTERVFLVWASHM